MCPNLASNTRGVKGKFRVEEKFYFFKNSKTA